LFFFSIETFFFLSIFTKQKIKTELEEARHTHERDVEKEKKKPGEARHEGHGM
jgi:hypothetical protein